MTWTTYLMLALLIAACIPLLDVIAAWYYLRFAKDVPAFGLAVPWARSAAPGRRPPQATQAEDAFVNEGGRAGFEPDTPKPAMADAPAATAVRLKDLAIGFDGRQYTFAGYRYDRLPDAIDDAERTRSRSALLGRS